MRETSEGNKKPWEYLQEKSLRERQTVSDLAHTVPERG
jgi:hypothetical protein